MFELKDYNYIQRLLDVTQMEELVRALDGLSQLPGLVWVWSTLHRPVTAGQSTERTLPVDTSEGKPVVIGNVRIFWVVFFFPTAESHPFNLFVFFDG